MNTRSRRATVSILAAAGIWGAAAGTGGVAPAYACGGFFCNNQPIDQSGEEIIFTVDQPANRVRAIIRISYTGEAKDFAWVLPVTPGLTLDEISTSSDQVFRTVRQLTEPYFQVNWVDNGNGCFFPGGRWDLDSAAGAGGPPNAGSEGGNAVTVVDQGQVGDYEVVILASTDAEELVEWLNDNGFVQPPESTPLIGHYLSQGMQFVALKLQQNKGAGDIVPVVLELEENEPCVPLVLTQIAATPDMPVRLWVLGQNRSIPTNWFHVVPNYKKYDWINLSWQGTPPNYMQVVTEAINEAEGRGFITEYAGASEPLKGALYNPNSYDLAGLKATTSAQEYVEKLQMMFSGTPELLSLLREFLPVPEEVIAQGANEQAFYNCPSCYAEAYAKLSFDPVAFTDAIEAKIIKPMRDAQEMFDTYPYLTRMLSIVSPDEMTRDPIFDFNSTLGDVSNVHTATGEVMCDGEDIELVLLTFPDGSAMYASLPEWYGQQPSGGSDDVSGEPFAGEVQLLAPDGDGIVLPRSLLEHYDRQLMLKDPAAVFAEAKEEVGSGGGGGGASGSGAGGGSGGGGCSAAGSVPWMAWVALALGAAFVRRRRGASID